MKLHCLSKAEFKRHLKPWTNRKNKVCWILGLGTILKKVKVLFIVNFCLRFSVTIHFLTNVFWVSHFYSLCAYFLIRWSFVVAVKGGGSPQSLCSVIAKELDCSPRESKFKLQWFCCVHFQTDTFDRGMNSLVHLSCFSTEMDLALDKPKRLTYH